MIMENIYTRDNYNISYKRFCSTKTKRRPGRPPTYINEPAVNCFVCDEKITRQKVNLLQGSSNNKDGFACQISQLLGDEFLIIVQEDDYLCKHCVLLFNNMDKFEKQLTDVKEKLRTYLNRKYDLSNKPSGGNTVHHEEAVKINKTEVIEEKEEHDDDSVVKQMSDLHAGNDDNSKLLHCNVCDFSTNNQNKLDIHLRDHINNAVETEFSENSRSSGFSDNNVTSSAIKLYKCSICLKVYLTKMKCIEHMKLYHVPAKSIENNEDVFNSLIKSGRNDKLVNSNLFYCKSCCSSFHSNDDLCKHSCGLSEKFCDESTSSSMKIVKDQLCTNLVKKDTTDKDEKFKIEKNQNKNNINTFFSTKGNAVDSLNFTSTTTSLTKENDTSVSRVYDNKDVFVERSNENLYTSENRDDKNIKTVSCDSFMDQEEEEEDDYDDDDDDDEDDDIGAGEVNFSEDGTYSDNSNNTDEEDDISYNEPEKHTCGNCGFKGDLVTLKEHFLEERVQRDLICSICGQSFNSFCKLIRHSSGHDIDSKPVECIYCPTQIRVPDLLSLTYHMKKVHFQLIDEKWCSDCDKVFPNLVYLRKHRLDKLCFNGKDAEERMNTCQDNTENLPNIENENENNDNEDIVKEECLSNFEEVNKKADPPVTNIDKHTDHSSNLSNRPNKNVDESIKLSGNIINNTNVKRVFNDCNSIYSPDKIRDDVEMDTTDSSDDRVNKALSVVYKCGICGEQRNSKDELLSHFESHNTLDNISISNDGVQKSVCNICGIEFSKDYIFKQHQRKHRKLSQNIVCLYCKNNFHDYVHLKYHIIQSHSYNINNLFCKLCNLKFNNNTNFRNHLFSIHQNGNYFCKKCDKNFNFKYKLLKHYCVHHKSELKCKFCGIISKNLSEHTKHERSHSQNNIDLKCSFCGRLFKRLYSLKLHSVRHACNSNLFCVTCELSFSDVNALNDHMHSMHKGDTDLYDCDKCGKCFMYYNRYRIHRLNHENERSPYECKLCHAKFNNLTLRAIHKRRLHKGKYLDYRCNFCNSFTTNNIHFYKKHLLLHIKKYEYHCKTCLKFYSNPNRLMAHQYRIHTRSRLYRIFSSKFCKLSLNESTTNCDRSYDNHLCNQSTITVKGEDSRPPLYCHRKNNESYVQ